MRIIHTIASTRAEHGGTSRSVPAICEALALLGEEVHFVVEKPASATALCGLPGEGTHIHALPESQHVRQWGMKSRFDQALSAIVTDNSPCIVHDHGVWLASNHAATSFSRRRGITCVVSPHGMLSSWALGHGQLKKRIAWHAYQRRDLAGATAFHATSDAEAAEIRALGFDQPIAVIPNGIQSPRAMPERRLSANRRTMLFMSRIHPKKGLLSLLEAWRLAAPGPEWRLVIAGPDDGGHRAEVERRATELGLAGAVSFPGEIADAEKWNWYAAADVFVLPSFSENFGLVVPEALASGVPVIATKGAPWSELVAQDCGWWVDCSVDALRGAIHAVVSLPIDDLRQRGTRGAKWARKKFAWGRSAENMVRFYEWLQSGETTNQFQTPSQPSKRDNPDFVSGNHPRRVSR